MFFFHEQQKPTSRLKQTERYVIQIMSANSALLKGMLGIAASPSEEMVSVRCSSAGQQKEGCGDNSSPGEAIIVAEKNLGKSKNNNKMKKKKKKSHNSPSNTIKDATAVPSEKQSKKTTKENNYAWSAFQSSPDPSTLPDIGGLFSTSLRVGDERNKQDVVCEESSSTTVEEEKIADSSFSSSKKNEKMEELLFHQQNSKEYEEMNIPIIDAAPKISKNNRHDNRTVLQHPQDVRQEEKQKQHQLFLDPIMELMNPGGYYYGMVMPPPIHQQHQYHHPMQYYQSPHHSSETTFLPPASAVQQFYQHLPPPCNNSSPVANTTILQNEEKD
jgi:hypothetical protein